MDDVTLVNSDSDINRRKQRNVFLGKKGMKICRRKKNRLNEIGVKRMPGGGKKKQKEEKEALKLKVGEYSMLQDKLKAEKNRTVLYSVPGSGCHKDTCNVHLSN